MKKVKFPSKKELTKVLKKLDTAEGSLVLSPDAIPLEKLRYDIYRQFVIYKREHKQQTEDLTKKIGINESQLRRILRFHHRHFSVDKLIDALSKIYPNYQLALEIS